MANLLTKKNVEELMLAFDHFFPENAVYVSDKPFVSGNFKWSDRQSFIETVKNLTGVDIKIGDKETVKNAQFVLEKIGSETPKAEENLPDKAKREAMEAERVKREEAIRKSAENAKVQVEASIKRQEELHKKTQGRKIYRRVSTPQADPLSADKQPTSETLRTSAQNNPRELTRELASEIEKRIKANVPQGANEEAVKALSTRAAVRVVENLRGNSLAVEAVTINKISNDTNLLESIENDDIQTFRDSAINVSTTELVEFQIDRKIISSSFGEDFASNYLGPRDLDRVAIEISSTPRLGFEEYDLGNVTGKQLDFLQRQDFVFDTISQVGSGEIKSVFLRQVGTWIESSIPESGALAEAYNAPVIQAALSYYGLGEPIAWEGTTFFGRVAVEFGYGPTFGWAGQITGMDFGVTQAAASISTEVGADAVSGALATTQAAAISTETAAIGGGVLATEGTAVVGGVTAAVAEGAGAAATATAATAATVGTVAATETTVAAASAAAAPVTGGVSLIIGAVVGLVSAVIGPKALDWMSKNAKKIDGTTIALGGAVAGMLISGGISGALIGAGLGLGAFGFMTGGLTGVGQAFSGTASSIFTVFSIAWATFLTQLGLPVISFLIGFPLMIALILVIINNSAYLIPPGGSSSSLNNTNPYMSVEKKAEPSGQLASPTSVTYTITITAKKDDLTGISFTNTCSAVKKAGGIIDCKNLEEIPAAPATITAGAPFTFSFTSNYNSSFNDSLVSDSITVTASSNEGGEVSETGSASVCFGDCPLGCFKTVDNNEPWPANFKANLDSASATLAGTYPNFAQKVCAGGEINMCYTTKSPNPIGNGLCNQTIYARHDHNGSCDINYNQCGIRSQSDALYILTHEVSHHLQNINGGTVSQFKQQVPTSEWAICSYSNTVGNEYESMAEGNALYVGTSSWVRCISNYASQYPKHYQFAKNVMFAP